MASDGEEDEEEEELSLEVNKHIPFWLRHLRLLPTAYTSGDVQRMTLAYFCLGALDLLGATEQHLDEKERHEYCDWIYSQQLSLEQGGGFCSSSYLPRSEARSNLAMTYTAILNLAILRDDFTRLDKAAILGHVSSLQQPDGSFAPSQHQDENDCRFVYCAFAICDMLHDWTAVNVDLAVSFLLESQSYDGGFGQGSSQESQGGSTYCAVASLALCNKISAIESTSSLHRWLMHRQQELQGGLNGRIEKAEDVCYSFWCGASAQILEMHQHFSVADDVSWLLQCQTPVGGISKTPGDVPDVMHSYLALAALAMHGQEGDARVLAMLKPIDPRLNISLDSLAWLRQHL